MIYRPLTGAVFFCLSLLSLSSRCYLVSFSLAFHKISRGDIAVHIINFNQSPNACAQIYGSVTYPEIRGIVRFYQTKSGVLVATEVAGLPYDDVPCGAEIFGFHIHEGAVCAGNATDPFADTDGHYNPRNCLHPDHAGDLPPLFGNQGFAFMTVFTNRFIVDEIIGKTVVIHRHRDDFTTQPSGDSGPKIACGQIYKNMTSCCC